MVIKSCAKNPQIVKNIILETVFHVNTNLAL